MRGRMTLAGVRLAAGDGACTEAAGSIALSALEDAEALLFDLG